MGGGRSWAVVQMVTRRVHSAERAGAGAGYPVPVVPC